MVKGLIINKKIVYQCEDCKLFYKDKKWAEKCEEWCMTNHTCNIAITKYKLDNKNEESF